MNLFILRHAIASAGAAYKTEGPPRPVRLTSPATPENVLAALNRLNPAWRTI